MPPNSIEYNADELQAPQWLNNDFFTKVLKHIEENDEVEIENLKLAPATAKGDHFASIMFRATVDYKFGNPKASKSTSLVLKTLPEIEGFKKAALAESFIFETEIGIYTQVVPKFKAILKAAGEPDTAFGPACLFHSLAPKKVIVFADLLPLGYEAQRQQQLSLHEVKVAYEKLAKWHAVSHKMLNENPNYFEAYRHGLVNMKAFYNSNKMKVAIPYFIEMLADHADLLPYKTYFEALNERDILKSAVASFNEYRNNQQENAFYVLCHGDFHYKNMMFRRDAKTMKLLDFMMLDFQLSYVGPAVNDLIYSFFLLLNNEQRFKHFDELLFCYHNKLKETLKKIAFEGKIPTMFDLRCQLMQHRDLALFLLTVFLPIWHAFKEGDYDGNKINTDAESHRELYRNANYLAEVRVILPKYLQMGYLKK